MPNIWDKISSALLTFKNIALIVIGFALAFALVDEAWEVAHIVFAMFTQKADYTQLIEEIIIFFLYFEFIALIVKYFKNNFHFPLRYFLYIGITAVVRLIIVQHDDAKNVLLWSGSILLLVISLAIAERFIKRD